MTPGPSFAYSVDFASLFSTQLSIHPSLAVCQIDLLADTVLHLMACVRTLRKILHLCEHEEGRPTCYFCAISAMERDPLLHQVASSMGRMWNILHVALLWQKHLQLQREFSSCFHHNFLSDGLRLLYWEVLNSPDAAVLFALC